MPNAMIANQVMCAEPGECCQPGTELVVVDYAENGNVIALEFCMKHAARRTEVPQPDMNQGEQQPSGNPQA